MDLWIRGFVDPRIHDPWIHGFMDSWIHGSMDSWIHGFTDSWILGFIDVLMHGTIDSLIHGFFDTCIHLSGKGLRDVQTPISGLPDASYPSFPNPSPSPNLWAWDLYLNAFPS